MRRATLLRTLLLGMILVLLADCSNSNGNNNNQQNTGTPSVYLNTPSPGASQLSGHVSGVDPSKYKIVIYALTNEWYVQPYTDAPYTNISPDGSWSSSTNPRESLVVLLVDPNAYVPPTTEITNPALDANVVAYTVYPAGPISVNFSGRTWGIKTTGSTSSDHFDPGPTFGRVIRLSSTLRLMASI